MTHSEVAKLIGRRGCIIVNGSMRVAVEIIDVKQAYGNLRYLVKPCDGVGNCWINADSIVGELDKVA